MPDATECKQCPEDNTQYQDSCDVNYGEFACDVFVDNGLRSLEECQDLSLERYFFDEKGTYFVVTEHEANGLIIGFRAMGQCNEGYGLVRFPVTEDEMQNGMWFETMDEALNVCTTAPADVPDGYLDMHGTLIPCNALLPIFTHSDGTRTEVSDCYGYSNPGNYVFLDMEENDMVIEDECQPGYYCPGNLEVRVDMDESGMPVMLSSGALACSALSGDHDVSPENATSAPGAIKPTDCYVDMGGDGASVTDSTGTYISSGGMCYYTE